MSIYPIVRVQLSFVHFSLLCYEFCIMSKKECKSIYYHFRRDHESSSFRKLARNKSVCRKTNTLLVLFICCTVSIIIMFIGYPLKALVDSFSSYFCETGQQPDIKCPIKSCKMVFLFFCSIQVPVLKSLLFPMRLFFVHVLLSYLFQLLKIILKSVCTVGITTGIIVTFFIPHILAISSLSIFYFSFSHPYVNRYDNIYNLNLLLGFITKKISGGRASVLISH